jgi:hypothetical protein
VLVILVTQRCCKISDAGNTYYLLGECKAHLLYARLSEHGVGEAGVRGPGDIGDHIGLRLPVSHEHIAPALHPQGGGAATTQLEVCLTKNTPLQCVCNMSLLIMEANHDRDTLQICSYVRRIAEPVTQAASLWSNT